MKIIKIRIPRKGMARGKAEIEIDAEGFIGQGCKTATEAFMKLGQEVENEEKPELFASDEGVEHLREGE
jgi:hypothetical protein